MKNNLSHETPANICQIKICGLTHIDEALFCAESGADAIGFVFYRKSPRYVLPNQARTIIAALPRNIQTVGVFVDESFNSIAEIVMNCGLKAIQLHGNESPEDVEKLKSLGAPVIKSMYMKGDPSIERAPLYNASAYLVECEKGILPGGNAMTWKWEDAAGFGKHHPFILAGGLTPDNVLTAISTAKPDAVDVSSGVEVSPGKKDIQKVRQFIANVKKYKNNQKLRRIFHESCQQN